MSIKAISTVIASILMLMIVIALGGTTYLYVSGTLIGKISTTFEIVDSINDTVIIRNSGTEPLTSITATLNGNTANTAVVPNIPGLVGYWSLNEGSGTTTDDNSDNNNIGTLSPSCPDCPSWVNGKFGKALQFDGVNDNVNAGSDVSLNFVSQDFTIGVWIKTTDTDGTIVERGLIQTDGYTLMFDPYVHLLTHQSGSYTYCRSQHPANSGDWEHWIAVRQGVNFRLYRNGIEDVPYTGGNCNAISSPVTSGRPLTIGRGNTWGNTNGIIDEVVVYNRALSESEIKQLYSGLVSPGQVATIKPLATLTKGTHTLRLCTSSMCNTAILTIT